MEATAKHDFKPADPETELAFRKGDKLLILNYGDPVQWYSAQMNGQTGLVPGNYIEVEKASWYLGRISRATAEQMLRNCSKDGAFLVRLSESSPSDFSLSVKHGNSVQHFRILKLDNQYFLWSTRFDSLNQLVEYYRHETVSRTSDIKLCNMDCDDDTFIVVAKYDFEANDENESEVELGFKQGDLIQVLQCTDENWWCGRIGDRSGYFPKTYVEATNLSPFKSKGCP